jgi:NAD(P)-dependent dehydrogenase (short-subunit alcohol dehydrogenase family)
MRFQGKVVVITGAGSGIGRESAFEFAAEGARVVASDIDQATAEGTVEEIAKRGGAGDAFALDTTDPSAVQTFFDTVQQRHGQMDVLVNSAGIREISPVVDLAYEQWQRVIAVNITGVFLCAQAFIQRLLKAERGGAIVNLASTLGVTAAPNRPAYVASKHAVVGLTKELGLEFGQQGIRVNAVGPGVTRTGLTERYFQDAGMAETIRSIHAMHRWGEAEEVARAILFLASDEASFITGTTLMVDGGWTAGRPM